MLKVIYNGNRKGKKLWHGLFFKFLEFVKVNVYVIHCELENLFIGIQEANCSKLIKKRKGFAKKSREPIEKRCFSFDLKIKVSIA